MPQRRSRSREIVSTVCLEAGVTSFTNDAFWTQVIRDGDAMSRGPFEHVSVTGEPCLAPDHVEATRGALDAADTGRVIDIDRL